MTNTYLINAWCIRPFNAELEVEADTPEQAITIARTRRDQLIDSAEDCEFDYFWDEFAAYDERGKELLHVLDEKARVWEAATVQAVLLDMLRYGVLTLSDGEAEFDGVIYAFDDNHPDWSAVLDSIGEQQAHAALARAKGGAQ